MKKFFKILVVLSVLFAAGQNLSAQWYYGGGIAGGFYLGRGGIGFVPEVGYRFTPHLSAGAQAGYIYDNGKSYNTHRIVASPYLRARYVVGGFLHLYADLFAQYNHLTYKYPDHTTTAEPFKAGLAPGLAIPMGGRSYFTARIGYLGYSNYGGWDYHISSSDVYLGFAIGF